MSKHKNKNQNVNNETVNEEVIETKEEEVEMTEKESVFTKIGNGVKKVVCSKPAKVVGVIALAAGAGAFGYFTGKKGDKSLGDDFDGYIDASDTLEEVTETADVTEEN